MFVKVIMLINYFFLIFFIPSTDPCPEEIALTTLVIRVRPSLVNIFSILKQANQPSMCFNHISIYLSYRFVMEGGKAGKTSLGHHDIVLNNFIFPDES